MISYYFWDLDRNTYGFLTSVFRQGGQNRILGFYRNNLWNGIFSQKNVSFLNSLGIWIEHFPRCLWKISREVVKTCFNVSRGICWAILFRKVLPLQFLSDFQRKLFWLLKKIVVVKFAIYLSRWKSFLTCSLWKKNISCLLGTSIWKSSEVRRNLLRMVVKTAFKVFGRFFWW